MIFQTDDKGVFSTSLSEELELAAKSFNLSDQDLWQLSLSTVDHIFASEDIKIRLRQKLLNFKEKCLSGWTDFVTSQLLVWGVLTCQSEGSWRHIAIPIPPPMHNAHTPRFAFNRFMLCNNVTRIRAPEAPIGWPKAMAPPLTFTLNKTNTRLQRTLQIGVYDDCIKLTFNGSIPSSRITAMDWAANASFNSIMSTSCIDQFAFFNYQQIQTLK